jgi:hypothetical protein
MLVSAFQRNCRRTALQLAVIVTVTAQFLVAQTNRGSITGVVTDPSGAPVAAATVTATESGTATTYTTTSTDAGTYNFPQVLVGTYELTVVAGSFQTYKSTGLIVQINTPTVANIQLHLGEQSQTVTVEADAPTVESTSSDIGAVVTPQQVQALPLSLGGVGAFRSPEAFAFLVPGTFGPGTNNNANGIYIQKTSGGQNFGDDVAVDGATAQRPDNNSTFDETSPSVEALQEFRIETATPPAQFDRTTGGVRSFTTRSGTNSFHGGVFDLFRNTLLDSNTYFNNLRRPACDSADCRSTNATPRDQQNDYGVTLGGPIVKNKTFFFFAWEQLRWPQSGTSTSTVPTAAERGGDFSQILTGNTIGTNPCTGAPVFAGQIFDPRSTTASAAGTPCRTAPFAGNIVSPTLFSPVASNALSYLPEANLPGLQNNFAFRSNFQTTNTTYTIRVDQNFSENDKIFGMYTARENSRLTGVPQLPAPIDPGTWSQDFITHYGRLGWDHTFGPTLLNHVTLAYDRWNSNNFAAGVTTSTNWPAAIGLANVNGPAFPQFNVGSGFPSLGQQRADDTISNLAQVADNLSWSFGRHTLTFGGDYRWIQLNNLTQDFNSGSYNFSNVETAAGPGALASQGGFSFASFLLGEVDSASLTAFAHYPSWRQNYWALYLQDDFRVTSHLTLNLGIRWSVDQPRSESRDYTSNFSPTTPNPGAGGRLGALIFASNCSDCNPRWADTYLTNVGPRIGLAWSPGNSGKTAVRAGYGILYGPLFYADFGNNMNAGYTASPNPVSLNGFSSAFNLSNGFPAYPGAPTLDPSLRNLQSVDYITAGFGKPPMVQTWSFQIQQQLATDLILSVGYVGTKSQNLRSAAGFGSYNNFPLQDLGLGRSVLAADIGSPAALAAGVTSPFAGFAGTVGDALRQYPQYRRFNPDCCLENDGMSTFHSLQVMLQRRMRNGLTVQAAYTWSKTLTDADSLLPGQNAGGGLYQNPYDLYQEKSISAQDIPQMFVGSFVYEMPFGKGKKWLSHGIASVLAGGWQIGGILRYQSGQPLPFYCASGVPGWDNCFRFNPVPGQSVYAASIHDPNFNPLTTPYLNNNFFADPNQTDAGALRFGALSRVTGYRMPMFNNEDVNISKRFFIRENVSVEVRGDAFNVANRHIFAQPSNLGPSPGNTATTNFGFVTGTIDAPRIVQLEARIQF